MTDQPSFIGSPKYIILSNIFGSPAQAPAYSRGNELNTQLALFVLLLFHAPSTDN